MVPHQWNLSSSSVRAKIFVCFIDRWISGSGYRLLLSIEKYLSHIFVVKFLAQFLFCIRMHNAIIRFLYRALQNGNLYVFNETLFANIQPDMCNLSLKGAEYVFTLVKCKEGINLCMEFFFSFCDY